MEYQDYIDLRFERTDMNDNVEFKETGYYGFTLERKFYCEILIVTYSGELNKPRLYL